MSNSLQPKNCSPPVSSVHGISQARILQWVVISFSSGSSQPRDGTCISCLAGGFFTTETPGSPGISHCGISHENSWLYLVVFVVAIVQSLSHVHLFVTPWTAGYQASLSFTISRSLLKLKSIKLAMPSNHLVLCRPLLLLPSIFPNIRVFSNESSLRIRWPKYWSFSFSISSSNEYSGLISFRIDWCDLYAVQGTLKSLLQHHSSKASILWCSAFFRVQL